jgi:RNA polymerase subunit RPABC4/transcription elongation factor Spt4
MFDSFKKSVGQTAAVAKWKADQMVRGNKTQQEINNMKREVASARDQIAGALLDMRQRGEPVPPEIEPLCANVDTLMAQVTEHEALLAAINAEQAPGAAPMAAAPMGATKSCPNCHTAVPAAAMFCTTCGYNFAAAPAPAAPKATVTCPNCHFEVTGGTAFCPNCGTRVLPAS